MYLAKLTYETEEEEKKHRKSILTRSFCIRFTLVALVIILLAATTTATIFFLLGRAEVDDDKGINAVPTTQTSISTPTTTITATPPTTTTKTTTKPPTTTAPPLTTTLPPPPPPSTTTKTTTKQPKTITPPSTTTTTTTPPPPPPPTTTTTTTTTTKPPPPTTTKSTTKQPTTTTPPPPPPTTTTTTKSTTKQPTRTYTTMISINNGFKVCGGSIIKENQVLTTRICCFGADYGNATLTENCNAGHKACIVQCFKVELKNGAVIRPIGAYTFTIFLGGINDYEPRRQIGKSTKYTTHIFNILTGFLDGVCIIFLDAPVSGKDIAIIRLPSWSQRSNTYERYKATVSGWRRTSNDGTRPKYTDVIVNEKTYCRRAYPFKSTFWTICTYDTNGSGFCDRFPGDPLTITESDGLETLIGITSFGLPFCDLNYPIGYVRVTSHLHLIYRLSGSLHVRP